MNTDIPVFDMCKPMPNEKASSFPCRTGNIYYMPIPGKAIFINDETVAQKYGSYVVWHDKLGMVWFTVMYQDEFDAFRKETKITTAAVEAPPPSFVSFDFGNAVNLMRQGKKLARKGWNGKNMFIYLAHGSKFQPVRPPISNFVPIGATVEYRPHIDMHCADGTFVPWVASQSDILACDWFVVE